MAGKKLLIVVDYQRDFVDGSLGFAGAEKLEQPICDKIRGYTAAGDDVIFTMDTHEQKYLLTNEGKHLPVKHCIKGTPGWQLYGKVADLAAGRTLIEKPTFGSVALAEWLKGKHYSVIELCGLVSSICVISNAVIAKAASPESEIIVDARCTAGADERLHREALDIMKNLHVQVVNDL